MSDLCNNVNQKEVNPMKLRYMYNTPTQEVPRTMNGRKKLNAEVHICYLRVFYS